MVHLLVLGAKQFRTRPLQRVSQSRTAVLRGERASMRSDFQSALRISDDDRASGGALNASDD
jgi:hypothetical protein